VELARSARVAAARVVLRVCDRGPGVPEAWRERIFEPFCRLPGHAEHEGGVGLGLSLVRQIARPPPRRGARCRGPSPGAAGGLQPGAAPGLTGAGCSRAWRAANIQAR
jgi:hypothetical protein